RRERRRGGRAGGRDRTIRRSRGAVGGVHELRCIQELRRTRRRVPCAGAGNGRTDGGELMAVTAHPSRLRVGSPDYLIVAAVAALVVLGIIAVYSSSFALGILEYGDANYFVLRQVF